MMRVYRASPKHHDTHAHRQTPQQHCPPEGEWVTAGVMSDGTHYGVPAGLNFGFPVTSDGGEWQVVDGLEISDATRAGIDHNIKALQEEYDAVKALGFIK